MSLQVRWRWAAGALGVVAAIAVAIVLLTGSDGRRGTPGSPRSGPPGLPPPGALALGVNVNRLFNERTYSLPEIGRQLKALEATGATDARSDALWEATEPQPPAGAVHHFNWTFDDLVAGELAVHHLRWLPIVDYSAPWAESIPGQEHSAPRLPAAYAAYAAALAARYGAGGAFWRLHPTLPPEPVTTLEIWNEPDGGYFWLPRSQPGPYAALYLLARRAIRAVDPSGRVIIGGLTNPKVSLPAMVKAHPTLRTHTDGVAVHIYGTTPRGNISTAGIESKLLGSLGMGTVPLYITEFGWTTHPRGAHYWAPARLRPRYIAKTMLGFSRLGCPLAGLFLYTWITPNRLLTNDQDWYGISPPAGRGSADIEAFTVALRRIRQAHLPLGCAGG